MYEVRYHTGAGDMDGYETIEDAKADADKHCAYTQAPISIYDEDGNEICTRTWWGVDYNEERGDYEDDPIMFPGLGYYGDWVDAE